MDSHIIKYAKERNPAFQVNDKLDALIARLKTLLEPIQDAVNLQSNYPTFPIIGVVGCPRAGTTFTTQLLAATGGVSFPSNLLSRFAYAPHIGAMIHQLLLDPSFDLGNEFADLREPQKLVSNVGKTRGANGISEFFHFWRRFFPNHDPGYLTDDQLGLVEIERLRKELGSIQSVYNMPFASKIMMLQYNLGYFADAMPELKIIHVQRNHLYLMQSVAEARREYYRNDKIWWSVKPEEYRFLKDEEPATQIAGQVLFTDTAISNQIKNLPADRWIVASYESICEDPHGFLNEVASRFKMPELGKDLSRIDKRYQPRNTLRLSKEELELLQYEYKRLSIKAREGRDS